MREFINPYRPIKQFYRLISENYIRSVEYYRFMRLMNGMITGSQIRAARSLLGWSQLTLADNAVVSETAIVKLETQSADTRTSTIMKVRKALEDAGIDFINRNDGAVGVVLRANQTE